MLSKRVRRCSNAKQTSDQSPVPRVLHFVISTSHPRFQRKCWWRGSMTTSAVRLADVCVTLSWPGSRTRRWQVSSAAMTERVAAGHCCSRYWWKIQCSVNAVHNVIEWIARKPDVHVFAVRPLWTIQNSYNICTMLDQRRRRWADVVQIVIQMFCACRESSKPAWTVFT